MNFSTHDTDLIDLSDNGHTPKGQSYPKPSSPIVQSGRPESHVPRHQFHSHNKCPDDEFMPDSYYTRSHGHYNCNHDHSYSDDAEPKTPTSPTRDIIHPQSSGFGLSGTTEAYHDDPEDKRPNLYHPEHALWDSKNRSSNDSPSSLSSSYLPKWGKEVNKAVSNPSSLIPNSLKNARIFKGGHHHHHHHKLDHPGVKSCFDHSHNHRHNESTDSCTSLECGEHCSYHERYLDENSDTEEHNGSRESYSVSPGPQLSRGLDKLKSWSSGSGRYGNLNQRKTTKEKRNLLDDDLE